MGFEPTTFGTTIRHSNRLSYIHHLDLVFQIGCKCNTIFHNDQIFVEKSEVCSPKFVLIPLFAHLAAALRPNSEADNARRRHTNECGFNSTPLPVCPLAVFNLWSLVYVQGNSYLCTN